MTRTIDKYRHHNFTEARRKNGFLGEPEHPCMCTTCKTCPRAAGGQGGTCWSCSKHQKPG